MQKLLVVLDLDETLVHATLCKQSMDLPPWLPSWISQPYADYEASGKGLILDIGEDVPLFVSVRPGAKEFTRWLQNDPRIEVAVYTAGTAPHACQALDYLGLGEASMVLFRDGCVPFGLPITKDLTKLRQDLRRVVLVDNSSKSFWMQPQNGLRVSDWNGTEPGDSELERVRARLEELVDLEDVRTELAAHSGPPYTQLLGVAVGAGALVASALSQADR